ncbi:temptin-like [Ostrea edulis]|uniref:temptin-like n=1 Tax=Ostrea edulis TaxID=37623 RepID=UPI0024AFC3BC|nr:temptin-like [Ostrea edulis]
MLLKAFLGCLLMTVAHFLPQYRNNILNGHSIPDPCCRGRVWARVGHTGPSQSGLNKFGIDFKLNGNRFTAQVCLADSDGDGVVNGIELGLNTTLYSVGTLCHFVGSYPITPILNAFLKHWNLLANPSGHPGFCDKPHCPAQLRYPCGPC